MELIKYVKNTNTTVYLIVSSGGEGFVCSLLRIAQNTNTRNGTYKGHRKGKH